MNCYLFRKSFLYLPECFVHHEKQPNKLFNGSDDKKGNENKPQNKEEFFIEDIDGKDTESVIVDDAAARSVNFQSALGHLGKYEVERIRSCG